MRLVRTLGVVGKLVPCVGLLAVVEALVTEVSPVRVVAPGVVDPIRKEEHAIFTQIKLSCYAHVMEHKR